MSTITPGTTIHGFQILSIDPTGRRLCIDCPSCKGVHIVAAAALCAGEFIYAPPLL